MADYPDLSPYVAESVIQYESYYTHYKAKDPTDPDEKEYIITEFNPAYMTVREANGEVTPSARFADEFQAGLDRFMLLSDSFLHSREPGIAPIEAVFKNNGTAYVVRQADRYDDLESVMGHKRMDYNDAYVLIRPLITSLAASWKEGLLFEFSPQDVRVNHFGQLILDSMFSWETRYQTTILELARLFYRLIAGVTYDSRNPDPSLEELELPPLLTRFIGSALSGETTYGSVDDFFKQLRAIMDKEGDPIIIYVDSADAHSEFSDTKKNTDLMLKFAAAILIVMVVVFCAVLFMMRTSHKNRLNSVTPTPATTEEISAPYERLHTAYASVNPSDSADILNGALFESGGIVYHRTSIDGVYGLGKSPANDSKKTTVLVENVRPSFIIEYDGYIYFCDGLTEYSILRVNANGGDAEIISDESASFLLIENGYLYYTNHSDRDRLYRISLTTWESECFLDVAAYETIFYAEHLFFINGSDNFRIYSFPLNTKTRTLRVLNRESSENLRLSNGNLYYRSLDDDTIKAITPAGDPVEVDIPITAGQFDIAEKTLGVINIHTGNMHFFDLETGGEQRTNNIVAYIYALDGAALILEYHHPLVWRLVSYTNVSE